MLLDRVDEDAEVVQERAFRVARVAGDQVEVGAADLEPAVAGRCEAERTPLLGRGGRIGGDECDVIEVELRFGLGLDEDDLETLSQVDARLAAVQRRDTEADPSQWAGLSRRCTI